jgi:hypothetical protein
MREQRRTLSSAAGSVGDMASGIIGGKPLRKLHSERTLIWVGLSNNHIEIKDIE